MIQVEIHWHVAFLTPSISIDTDAECDEPICRGHIMLGMSFLFWTVEIVFN